MFLRSGSSIAYGYSSIAYGNSGIGRGYKGGIIYLCP